MEAAAPADPIAALRRLDSCSVANAIEATGVRLRNEGYADATVKCMMPSLTPLVGHAFTLAIRTTRPIVREVHHVDHVAWAEQLAKVPAPRILVVQDLESGPGTGAFMGEVHANIYRALGCAGVITDGAVRDVAAVYRLGFPVFSRYVSVSHAYVHLVAAGEPITVGGLTVRTGDLLHGDRHGVVSIPLNVAPEIPRIALRQRMNERDIIDLCQSGDFSVERLERLLQRIQSAHPLPE